MTDVVIWGSGLQSGYDTATCQGVWYRLYDWWPGPVTGRYFSQHAALVLAARPAFLSRLEAEARAAWLAPVEVVASKAPAQLSARPRLTIGPTRERPPFVIEDDEE